LYFRKRVICHRCHGITIEECKIGHLDLFNCYNCLFKDCLLHTISIKNCRGNTFERVKPEWYITYKKINPPIHISKRINNHFKKSKAKGKTLKAKKYDKKHILQYPPNEII